MQLSNKRNDFLYVSDFQPHKNHDNLIKAFLLYSNKSESLNIASGVETSIHELVNTLMDLMNFKAEIIWNKNKPIGASRRALNIDKAKSELKFKTYKTMFRDDIILTSDLSSGIISGSDASIMNRFTLGGDRLKGFRNQGIGPYDTLYNTPLGGKMFTSLSLQASFPIGVPEEYGIFGGLFIDTGSLWGLDNTASGRVDDSANIRSAAGVSIFWDSAIGPLRFNWSRPIKRESYDVIENFRFTIDTRF